MIQILIKYSKQIFTNMVLDNTNGSVLCRNFAISNKQRSYLMRNVQFLPHKKTNPINLLILSKNWGMHDLKILAMKTDYAETTVCLLFHSQRNSVTTTIYQRDLCISYQLTRLNTGDIFYTTHLTRRN